MLLPALFSVIFSVGLVPLDFIVPLESVAPDGGYLGTSFLIDPTHLMTAAHVVSHENTVITAICDNGKQQLNIKNIYVDKVRDLAIITLNEKCSSEIIPLAEGNSMYGQFITTIGCPEEKRYCGMLTKGMTSLYRKRDGVLVMYADLRIFFGNSGGPVLNADQKLVGIVIEIVHFSDVRKKDNEIADVVSQNYALITPISEIQTFLKNFKAKK